MRPEVSNTSDYICGPIPATRARQLSQECPLQPSNNLATPSNNLATEGYRTQPEIKANQADQERSGGCAAPKTGTIGHLMPSDGALEVHIRHHFHPVAHTYSNVLIVRQFFDIRTTVKTVNTKEQLTCLN